MAWDTSNRRARLPKDWPRLRRFVLRRDRWRCRIQGPRCTTKATDVDHIIAGDDHRPDNLQSACGPCHQDKTLAERPKPATRQRPPEKHPGLT